MNDSSSDAAPLPQPTMADALALFQKHWGHPSFKEAQGLGIQAVLDKKDALLVLTTGYGKSAIFQVPALLLEGTVLVISPLIALMKDQVDDCLRRGIPASFINSHVDEDEIDDRLTLLRRGEYKLFYVAPERIGSAKFRDTIQMTNVSLLAVDEAHCASRWGHDFRPAYMKIHVVAGWLESNGRPPILAVTATATADIEEDICKSIGMQEYIKVIGDPIRPNLKYEVLHGNAWKNFENMVRQFKRDGSRYVIYSGTRAGCEKLAEIIDQVNPAFNGRIGFYHAGMMKAERESVQDGFKEGRIDIVVATNAFGMGIDVPNIRVAAHFGIPGTMEDYCQEGGRAGRDGLISRLILIHSDYSVELRQKFLDAANPRYESYQTVWTWLHEHNNRGDTISLTAEDFSIKVYKDTEVMIPKEEIQGVLSSMDSYGIIIRAASEQGIQLTCYLDEIAKAVESGNLSSTQDNLCEYILTATKPETPAPAPPTTRNPAGLKAMVSVPKPIVEYGLDLEACAIGLKLSESAIRAQLRRLSELRLIDIGKAFRGKTTKVAQHCWGDKIEDLIPEESVAKKRAREVKRLDAMIKYCFTPDRVKFIREYFLGKK